MLNFELTDLARLASRKPLTRVTCLHTILLEKKERKKEKKEKRKKPYKVVAR